MNEINLTDAQWRKSSLSSGDGQCVEVAMLTGAVAVRDSKNPGGPVLTFSPAEWDAFVGGVRNSEFSGQ